MFPDGEPRHGVSGTLEGKEKLALTELDLELKAEPLCRTPAIAVLPHAGWGDPPGVGTPVKNGCCSPSLRIGARPLVFTWEALTVSVSRWDSSRKPGGGLDCHSSPWQFSVSPCHNNLVPSWLRAQSNRKDTASVGGKGCSAST